MISALHANRKETAWVECDSKVGAELHMRSSPASVAFLPDILQRGVQVLMFAGAEDLICNYKGIERMIEHLDWSGEIGFGGVSVLRETALSQLLYKMVCLMAEHDRGRLVPQ